MLKLRTSPVLLFTAAQTLLPPIILPFAEESVVALFQLIFQVDVVSPVSGFLDSLKFASCSL
ncbi:hypothetical protein D3C86_2156940 [compost metagenome]